MWICQLKEENCQERERDKGHLENQLQSVPAPLKEHHKPLQHLGPQEHLGVLQIGLHQ